MCAAIAAQHPPLPTQGPPALPPPAQSPPVEAPPPQGPPAAATESAVIRIPGMRSLTITGQYRIRYENKIDFDFNRDAGASNDFFTQRVRLNFAPEFNDDLSAMVQLQDARDWGEEQSTLEDDADGLDLHQAWMRVKRFPGVCGEATIGRQAVALGSQRLISALEWPSQGRSFDGWLHRWDDGCLATNAFFFQTREILNATNDDAYFTGVFATGYPLDGATTDAYALFLRNDETAAGDNENRLTLGGRWLQRCGGLQAEVEYATQVGDLDGNDIPIGEAYALAFEATYRCEDAALQPWGGGGFDLASGDRPGTAAEERFNTLFPFAHYYNGYMDLALWENLQHVFVEAGVTPCPRFRVAAYWHWFRAMEETDAFFGPNGTLSPGLAGQSQTMGNELDLKLNYDLDVEPLTAGLETGYGVFFPGPGTEQAQGADDPAHFVYVQADFRF